MRLSQHFGRTLREAPADATMASHKWIIRAGLARPLAAGIWTYLPLGFRVIRRLENIIREEMDAIGTEEMRMPVLHPAEVWQATGRWDSVDVLMRLQNREGREFALGATHEEVVVDLVRREIESYKDLPRAVYQIQTKERDEPRARGGLIRLREFTMKDAYSMHATEESLDEYYNACYRAYVSIFNRVGLETIPVEADTGMMGGKVSHEFMLPHPQGEDSFVRCENCDYAANVEAAEFVRSEALHGEPKPLEKVETPDCRSIAQLAEFLGIEEVQTLKMVFYTVDAGEKGREIVLALLRGDLDVSEVKLKNEIGGGELIPATEEEIAAIGAVAGFASPIGLNVRTEQNPDGVLVIADESLKKMSNFTTGANELDYHYINANFPRDFQVTRFADIAEPYDGATCARCGGKLRIDNAIELGHCFKLGTRYSEPVGATFLDADGQERLVIMGSYGIGLDRLLAAIIEEHHDENGIVWPRAVAPYDVHIVALARDEEITRVSDQLYNDLNRAGIATVYDDRDLSPGVKFNDADIMGMPLRVTVSSRSLQQGGVEVKWRWSDEREIIPLDGAVERIAKMLSEG
ncbi:MAG TPA: proline--tRNA ligase [Aggregatilineales bacterium]|nr:proline--tRNA ligase [Aggregatilineales bacterium]HPV08582.1 proline--tRNA ligase [Aggregatilineales bacterium]HQA69787.1 proline--tRNA ligase [Aggregatilineales bacterium]